MTDKTSWTKPPSRHRYGDSRPAVGGAEGASGSSAPPAPEGGDELRRPTGAEHPGAEASGRGSRARSRGGAQDPGRGSGGRARAGEGAITTCPRPGRRAFTPGRVAEELLDSPDVVIVFQQVRMLKGRKVRGVFWRTGEWWIRWACTLGHDHRKP